jgi:hypothetical protein
MDNIVRSYFRIIGMQGGFGIAKLIEKVIFQT